jgi:hypothetical protein
MISNCIKIFMYSLLVICIPCHAFIYRIDILQPTNNKEQYILCLSDFHDKTHPATHPQQKYLDTLLDQLVKKNAYVLVEDLSSPNTKSGATGCGSFSVDSRGGILGGLSATCKQKQIPVENVEYRFCRVAAFGPVLNNPNKSPNSLESANKITVDAIVTEIKQAIARVQLFRDGPNLQKHYDQSINTIFNDLTQLQLTDKLRVKVADYLTQQTTSQTRPDALKRLLTFDSGLLDMSFVHAIVQAHDKKIILLVAGGAHINNVCELLEKIGYKRIYNTPVAYIKEHNLNGCIGSRIIDENYCVKPEAVNLDEVNQFIDLKPTN